MTLFEKIMWRHRAAISAAVIVAGLLTISPAPAHAVSFPMAPWSPEQVESLLPEKPDFHPFPTYNQRDVWERLRQNPLFADSLTKIIEQARQQKDQPIPSLTATLYLDVYRTGRRERWERINMQRRDALATAVLAECVAGQGEFLDNIIDIIWAVCEESCWTVPAHALGLPKPEKTPIVDLYTTDISAELAQIDYVLGDALPPVIRHRIRYEIDRRLFVPLLEIQDDFKPIPWLKETQNWSAVCGGDAIRTALYLEPQPHRVAALIAKAQNAMCYYLAGFSNDGGMSEGLAYWSYGFGRYVAAARLLRLYSDNRLDLLAPPIIRSIALFPSHTELLPGVFPDFADGKGQLAGISALPTFFCYLGDALNSPALRTYGLSKVTDRITVNNLETLCAAAFWATASKETGRFAPEPFVFLPGVQWMISHADCTDLNSLILVVKGGTNDIGSANAHRDLGQLIVYNHSEPLLIDIGPARYDRDYFGPKRYTYLATRSGGHSVPVVNGCEQIGGPGTTAASSAEHTDTQDRFTTDLTAAYPAEAGLKQLTRTVTLQRATPATIILKDQASFQQPPKSFISPLMTYARVELPNPGAVLIRGEKGCLSIAYDPAILTCHVQEIDTTEAKLAVASQHPIVRRIEFQPCDPLSSVLAIELHIAPREPSVVP